MYLFATVSYQQIHRSWSRHSVLSVISVLDLLKAFLKGHFRRVCNELSRWDGKRFLPKTNTNMFELKRRKILTLGGAVALKSYWPLSWTLFLGAIQSFMRTLLLSSSLPSSLVAVVITIVNVGVVIVVVVVNFVDEVEVIITVVLVVVVVIVIVVKSASECRLQRHFWHQGQWLRSCEKSGHQIWLPRSQFFGQMF